MKVEWNNYFGNLPDDQFLRESLQNRLRSLSSKIISEPTNLFCRKFWKGDDDEASFGLFKSSRHKKARTVFR